MARLVITLPHIGDIVHDLNDDVLTIGNAPDNVIQIQDPSVSGHHAKLFPDRGHYTVCDLNSAGGTLVNGIPVKEVELIGSCMICFGRVESVFKLESPAQGSSPASRELDELREERDAAVQSKDHLSTRLAEMQRLLEDSKRAAAEAATLLSQAASRIESLAREKDEIEGELRQIRETRNHPRPEADQSHPAAAIHPAEIAPEIEVLRRDAGRLKEIFSHSSSGVLQTAARALERLLRVWETSPERFAPANIRNVSTALETLERGARANWMPPDLGAASILAVRKESAEDEAALQEAGFTICNVTDAATGFAMLAAEDFSLVLADDESTEGIRGMEIYSQVRAMPRHRDTPVLFVADPLRDHAWIQSAALSKADFILRPCDSAEIVLKALAALTKERAPESAFPAG